jgi:hypothetical protein
MNTKTIAALALALALTPAVSGAQQQIQIAQTGVGWIDKMSAIVQSIIGMGADAAADNAATVAPNQATTTQQSLTQVLKAMVEFSGKISAMAQPASTANATKTGY